MIGSRLPAWAASLASPVRAGDRTLPPPALVLLATVGLVMLAVVGGTKWADPWDEQAYWNAARDLLAGRPLYDPGAHVQTPGAYWYPPVAAQVLVPLVIAFPDLVLRAAWTALLLGCLLFLARGRLLLALAFVAFLPVWIELWYRNVHLPLAVLAVLALRRWPLLWVVGAAVKLTPVIGVVYLAAAGRRREALRVSAVGLAVLVVSVLLSPGAWGDFIAIAAIRAPASTGGFVAVPFLFRLAVAVALAIAGGRIGGRRGETLLVVGLVVGNPTLWLVAFSMLIALVPIWWDGRDPPRVPAHDQRTGSSVHRTL